MDLDTLVAWCNHFTFDKHVVFLSWLPKWPQGFLLILGYWLMRSFKHVRIILSSWWFGTFFSIYWEQSSQLTFILCRGVGRPPTSYIFACKFRVSSIPIPTWKMMGPRFSFAMGLCEGRCWGSLAITNRGTSGGCGLGCGNHIGWGSVFLGGWRNLRNPNILRISPAKMGTSPRKIWWFYHQLMLATLVDITLIYQLISMILIVGCYLSITLIYYD